MWLFIRFGMHVLTLIFGQGKDLDTLQMVCRGVVVFIIALVLIRISGRRSFGIRTPLDNIILVLLGAVLSRAVVGASPFVPTIVTCGVIVIMHRCIGYFIVCYNSFGKLVEGKKILLFKDNKFIKENLKKGLVCEEDIMQGVRKSALTDNMQDIDMVYIERNGEISAIRKNKEQ